MRPDITCTGSTCDSIFQRPEHSQLHPIASAANEYSREIGIDESLSTRRKSTLSDKNIDSKFQNTDLKSGQPLTMVEGTLERDQSVRIANFTEIPLVYVISQLGPLYWGVVQPNERVTRCTGRVWFTVTCYPWNGSNEPDTGHAVLQTLMPSLAMLGVVVTGGIAAIGAGVAATGTAAAALAPILPITATPTAAMLTSVIHAPGMTVGIGPCFPIIVKPKPG